LQPPATATATPESAIVLAAHCRHPGGGGRWSEWRLRPRQRRRVPDERELTGPQSGRACWHLPQGGGGGFGHLLPGPMHEDASMAGSDPEDLGNFVFSVAKAA